MAAPGFSRISSRLLQATGFNPIKRYGYAHSSVLKNLKVPWNRKHGTLYVLTVGCSSILCVYAGVKIKNQYLGINVHNHSFLKVKERPPLHHRLFTRHKVNASPKVDTEQQALELATRSRVNNIKNEKHLDLSKDELLPWHFANSPTKQVELVTF